MVVSSDSEWAAALAEVDSAARQPGLWARCFAQAGGDENKAKAAYIAERVAAMAAAPPVVAKPEPTPDGVCPSCGRACWLNALSCPQCAAVFGQGSSWQPRERQLGEVVVANRELEVARVVAAPSQPASTSKGTNWVAWAIGVPVGLFLLMLAIGASISPEKAAQYDKAARIDAACDRMISDSALGDERRMTRAMCDQMKSSR